MAYFYNFPVIPYDSFGDGNFSLVTNILRRVGLRTKVKSNKLFFDTYDVKEGETPESLADKLYGEPPAPEGGGDVDAEEPGLDMGSEETADFDMGGPETEAPGAGEEVTEPVAAAESYNQEKGLPLLMEKNQLSLSGLEDVVSRTNQNINTITENIDELLED